MRTVMLGDGSSLPVLGLGTWHMGESRVRRVLEVAAVRAAFELGYRLIDTAEMYGSGGAEEIVGEALSAAIVGGVVAREDVFLVSKVLPHNAGRRSTVAACEKSLRRLGVDCIDLYLLHWRGEYPLSETVDAFEALKARGLIRHWGVSNFDVDDLHELAGTLRRVHPGAHCAVNQVYYSITERGPEFSLMRQQRALRMPLMAYSPIDEGALAEDAVLAMIGERRGLSAAQVALAFVLSQPSVIAIPKAIRLSHLAENFAAAEVVLDAAELAEIDQHFPGPRHKQPLAMR